MAAALASDAGSYHSCPAPEPREATRRPSTRVCLFVCLLVPSASPIEWPVPLPLTSLILWPPTPPHWFDRRGGLAAGPLQRGWSLALCAALCLLTAVLGGASVTPRNRVARPFPADRL